jgi:hypothetical protein
VIPSFLSLLQPTEESQHEVLRRGVEPLLLSVVGEKCKSGICPPAKMAMWLGEIKQDVAEHRCKLIN